MVYFDCRAREGWGWGGVGGRNTLLESKEEGAGPDDEEQGQVEDSLLPGHHHPSVAAERVFTGELLPFSHLPCDHHRRHVVPLFGISPVPG